LEIVNKKGPKLQSLTCKCEKGHNTSFNKNEGKHNNNKSVKENNSNNVKGNNNNNTNKNMKAKVLSEIRNQEKIKWLGSLYRVVTQCIRSPQTIFFFQT
jgi:hypothetical protein